MCYFIWEEDTILVYPKPCPLYRSLLTRIARRHFDDFNHDSVPSVLQYPDLSLKAVIYRQIDDFTALFSELFHFGVSLFFINKEVPTDCLRRSFEGFRNRERKPFKRTAVVLAFFDDDVLFFPKNLN